MRTGDLSEKTGEKELKTMKVIAEGRPPIYANEFAAGMDLSIADKGGVDFESGDHKTIHTGVKLAIPEGYFGLVCIRSSLGRRGLILSNGVGIIDPDYRGEIMIPLFHHGKDPIRLEEGERVAQMVLMPYIQVAFEEVEELDTTDRGHEGFGSSGRF
ncbi:MAG: dUTP diphosphatase [Firmicutes bacterium]|nr:dUTP diphosphatase [Bacillota bacterium]